MSSLLVLADGVPLAPLQMIVERGRVGVGELVRACHGQKAAEKRLLVLLRVLLYAHALYCEGEEESTSMAAGAGPHDDHHHAVVEVEQAAGAPSGVPPWSSHPPAGKRRRGQR